MSNKVPTAASLFARVRETWPGIGKAAAEELTYVLLNSDMFTKQMSRYGDSVAFAKGDSSPEHCFYLLCRFAFPAELMKEAHICAKERPLRGVTDYG